MVETAWPALSGVEVTYGDHTWEFTGAVEVGPTGDTLGVEATQTDDVRRRTATLRFGLPDDSPSLNPGDLDAHFDRFERDGEALYLVVSEEPRTYRYELRGIGYD